MKRYGGVNNTSNEQQSPEDVDDIEEDIRGLDTVDMEESNIYDEKTNMQETVFKKTGVCATNGLIKKCKEAKPRRKPGHLSRNKKAAFPIKFGPNQMDKLRGDSGLLVLENTISPDKIINRD